MTGGMPLTLCLVPTTAPTLAHHGPPFTPTGTKPYFKRRGGIGGGDSASPRVAAAGIGGGSGAAQGLVPEDSEVLPGRPPQPPFPVSNHHNHHLAALQSPSGEARGKPSVQAACVKTSSVSETLLWPNAAVPPCPPRSQPQAPSRHAAPSCLAGCRRTCLPR